MINVINATSMYKSSFAYAVAEMSLLLDEPKLKSKNYKLLMSMPSIFKKNKLNNLKFGY